jgi:hypothetical protein
VAATAALHITHSGTRFSHPKIGKVFRYEIMCLRDDSLKTKEKTSQTKLSQRGRRTYDHVVALTDTTVH